MNKGGTMKITNSVIGEILFLGFCLSLLSCGGIGRSRVVKNPTNQDTSVTAIKNWNSSLEQLKQEVLDKTCDDQTRLYYKNQIERQSKYLNPAQLETSMKNMQEDIVCNN